MLFLRASRAMHRRSKDNKPKFGSHIKLALSYANKVNRLWATDRQQKHDPANQLRLAFPAAQWRINLRIQLSLLRSSPLARWGSEKVPSGEKRTNKLTRTTWPKTRRPGRVLRTRPARHLEYIWLKLSESCRQKGPTSAAAYRTSGVLAWVLTFLFCDKILDGRSMVRSYFGNFSRELRTMC